jgi:hypothetical protein
VYLMYNDNDMKQIQNNLSNKPAAHFFSSIPYTLISA